MAGAHTCCDGQEVKRGFWSPEEDQRLFNFIVAHGHHCGWSSVPRNAGLRRCGKSCRLRWKNYLHPDIRHGMLSAWEAAAVFELHSTFGNKWTQIAKHLPGRTGNQVKNFWNANIRLQQRQQRQQQQQEQQ